MSLIIYDQTFFLMSLFEEVEAKREIHLAMNFLNPTLENKYNENIM